MENRTVNHLGQLYKLLTTALGEGEEKPINQTNLNNASRFPVRQVSMTVAIVHRFNKMTKNLEEACTFVFSECTEKEMEDSFNLKAVPIEQQGAFMIGYQTANIFNIVEPPMRIKMARQNAGLTIRELAQKINVSPTTIQYIENGKVEPRTSTLQKIAEACDTTMNELWPIYC